MDLVCQIASKARYHSRLGEITAKRDKRYLPLTIPTALSSGCVHRYIPHHTAASVSESEFVSVVSSASAILLNYVYT